MAWELTEELKAQIPAHTKEWEAIILSTDRIDKEICESSVKKLFKIFKDSELRVGFVQSPVVGQFSASVLSLLWQLQHDPLDSGLVLEMGVKTHLIQKVSEYLNKYIGETAALDFVTVVNDLCPEVPEGTTCEISVIDEVFVKVLHNISNLQDGGNEAGSCDCCITFVRDIGGVDLKEHANYKYWENLTRYGGVRWTSEDFCIISDRPVSIDLNQSNQLHNEEGPAKLYNDGLSLWYIEGVKVTKQIVMEPDTLKVEDILKEDNEEVRRICIMRYGDKFFTETETTELDRNENDIECTRETLLQITSLKFLRTFCPSTGKIFVLPVSEDVNSCAEAQSWLWGVDDASKTIIGRT